MDLLQPMMVAMLLLGGMGVALLGTIKVPLARRLQIDEAKVGGLVSLFGFTLIPVNLAAGFATDLVSREAVLITGSALLAVSFLLLAIAGRYSVALLAVLLFSAAWALLINVGNVLTPAAFPSDPPGDIAYSTNLANVIFGIGAFLTPLAVGYLVRQTSLPLALGVLACLALAPAGLALGVDFAPLSPAAPVQADAGTDIGDLLGNPILWLCGFALFFYGPLEASLAAWTTTYLGDKGFREQAASNLFSAFWLTYIAARLVTAFTLPAGHEATLILVLGLLSVALLGGLVVCRDRMTAAVLVVAAGLVFGPIFPTLMAILLTSFPASLHGRAVGLLFAIGGIGWTLIPILIGAYARRVGVQRGFRIAVGAAVGLSVVALLLTTR